MSELINPRSPASSQGRQASNVKTLTSFVHPAEWSLGAGLFISLALLAFGLRFYGLGAVPLSEAEATEALAAWRFANGLNAVSPALPASPLLHTLQALTFWIIGRASEALARFWPALAGTAVVLFPVLIRQQIGRTTALLATALLAFSPALITASRTGDSTTLALLCLMGLVAGLQWFVTQDDRRGLYLSSVALGAGLACGGRFLTVVLVSGVGWLLTGAQGCQQHWSKMRPVLRFMIFPTMLSFGLLCTGALYYPLGLSAVGESHTGWGADWWPGAGQRPMSLIVALALLYEPLTLVLGIPGVCLAARQHRPARVLLVLAMVGLTFVVLFPGRQSSDLLLVSLALTVMAAMLVVEVFQGEWGKNEAGTVAVQSAGLLMMLGYAYVNLAGYEPGPTLGWDPVGQKWGPGGLVVILLILGGLLVLLFAAGWSWRTTNRGVVGALLVGLSACSFSAGWELTQTRGDSRVLWASRTTSPSLKRMVETIEDISRRTVGNSRDVEITVVVDPAGSLGWVLREFPGVVWVNSLSPTIASSIVITPSDMVDPILGSSYMGQEFLFATQRKKRLDSRDGIMAYLDSRADQVSIEPSRLVLWVRKDVHLLEVGQTRHVKGLARHVMFGVARLPDWTSRGFL